MSTIGSTDDAQVLRQEVSRLSDENAALTAAAAAARAGMVLGDVSCFSRSGATQGVP